MSTAYCPAETAEGAKRDEALSSFMAVTGQSDIPLATNFLETCNWQLESAIGLYFSSQPDERVASSSSSNTMSSSSDANFPPPLPMYAGSEHEVRAPDAHQVCSI